MLELSERKKLVVVKLAPSWIERTVHKGISLQNKSADLESYGRGHQLPLDDGGHSGVILARELSLQVHGKTEEDLESFVTNKMKASSPDVGPSVTGEGRCYHHNVVCLHLEILASYWST